MSKPPKVNQSCLRDEERLVCRQTSNLLRIPLDIGIQWEVLFYLTGTKPDIAHIVYIWSQFECVPTNIQFGHLLYVLRYLRRKSSKCLFYAQDSSLQLHAYSGFTWASDPIDRRSIIGYCIFLVPSPIAWNSKKQASVSVYTKIWEEERENSKLPRLCHQGINCIRIDIS